MVCVLEAVVLSFGEANDGAVREATYAAPLAESHQLLRCTMITRGSDDARRFPSWWSPLISTVLIDVIFRVLRRVGGR